MIYDLTYFNLLFSYVKYKATTKYYLFKAMKFFGWMMYCIVGALKIR